MVKRFAAEQITANLKHAEPLMPEKSADLEARNSLCPFGHTGYRSFRAHTHVTGLDR
jgi:hypothetical protein